MHVLGLLAKINDAGHLRLHAKGQIITLHARQQLLVWWVGGVAAQGAWMVREGQDAATSRVDRAVGDASMTGRASRAFQIIKKF